MKTKEEFIKRLRSDPLYKSALKTAKTEEERRMIIAKTEAFVSQYAEILAPIIKMAEESPEYLNQLRRSFNEGNSVITEVEPETSSSKG